MDKIIDEEEKLTEVKSSKISWLKIFGRILAVFLFFSFGILTSVYLYYQKYEDKVYPGIFLGSYDLGGMDKEELKSFVENLNNRLIKEDINYFLLENNKKKNFRVETVLPLGEDSLPLITFYTDEFVEKVFKIGREKQNWQKFISPIYLLVKNKNVEFDLKFDKENFKKNLFDVLGKAEEKAYNANIKVIKLYPLQYEIIPEKAGQVFDYDNIVAITEENLKSLKLDDIQIERHLFLPKVLRDDLQNVEEQLKKIIQCGDLILIYDALLGKRNKFILPISEFSSWLVADKREDGSIYFVLAGDKFENYLKNLKEVIDIPVQNPKFTIVNGKVKEFKEQEAGLSLQIDKTKEVINDFFKNGVCENRSTTLNLVVEKVESQIKLTDLNSLGINELLGTGTSTFYDSHTNRIKNIAHAVELLNGVLIAPGEVFSALKYAGPFTAENGYLPEEIIKGDKIIKEVGGGMCQIGTTLFRMAMNSGMDIVERHNHSLVVHYYADPINKNPGTDAALYEPFLDLKFNNDTGNYLLLQTQIDYKKQMLIFSLWGKSDGRKGFYTSPIVSKWIPAGDPKEVVSEDLKPGETKCQNAFRGAVSSFTYTRFTSTSERIDRVFTSYYRPLAKLCLVGPSISTSTQNVNNNVVSTTNFSSNTLEEILEP